MNQHEMFKAWIKEIIQCAMEGKIFLRGVSLNLLKGFYFKQQNKRTDINGDEGGKAA